MSWQNNWPPIHQTGLVPAYPPPLADVSQLPSTAPVPDYGAFSADQYKQWQWQQYHMQYAQWHAQYGEQYARETGKSLPPVATPGLQTQPIPHTLSTNPLPVTPVVAGTSFAALSMIAPPPPAEPHPDELNLSREHDKPPLPEEKSVEELAFDEQFHKWEQEFETWKHNNKNHPDKVAYREYEQKCMNCRGKLLERREQLRQKRVQSDVAQKTRSIAIQPVANATKPPEPLPCPPASYPVASQDRDRHASRQKNHRGKDSHLVTDSGLENVFSQSASVNGGGGTGGIPGLDLIDEHPPPLPKKIKLEDDLMEVIDLANNDEQAKPTVSETNNTANALSSLLNDPKVNALLQLVGNTIAGGSGNGSGSSAGGSNTGGTNSLVAALAQLTNSKTGKIELEKLNKHMEKRSNGSVEPNDEATTSKIGRSFTEETRPARFNPRIPPPLLDIDLSRPPPSIQTNKRQQQDRWNNSIEQDVLQNGSYPASFAAGGSPLAKVARFDRPPPPVETHEIGYQIDPELGRPVAVPKPNWMTEDEYQEIYDRYEHVRSFEERKNKMELAIHVLKQRKIRDGQMGLGDEPLHQMLGGMPKPLTNVKSEIISPQPDEFFQPQQVFDYTNCRNSSASTVNHGTPAGRVIDYGHCTTGKYNTTNTKSCGTSRREGFRHNQNSGSGHEFGSNTQRFDYNHSRVANITTNVSVTPQQYKQWPLENKSVLYDRSVPGLERLAQMHLNPNPEESNPNYPSKFLLMNDNRPSCLSTKRGKRPSSIRKQKLKQQLQQQQLENLDTPQIEPESSVSNTIIGKAETVLELEDLSSEDDTIDERVDGDNSTDDSVRRIKQEFRDERPESVISSQSSQHHSATRILDIEDLLYPPGRLTRPARICLLVRGLPGSGKSFLARLIKIKEQALGPSPRVLSLDDYFLVDKEEEEKDPVTGKVAKVTRSRYEFDRDMEEIYIQNLLKAYKRTISERLFNFVIVDCCNHRLEYYCEFHNYARSNGFKVYTCTMQTDIDLCARRNIHGRTAVDIQAYADSWAMAPEDHVQINFNGLLQQDTDTTTADIEVAAPEERPYAELGGNQLEHTITSNDEGTDDSADSIAECDLFASKWDNDGSEQNLAKLDGISKPLKRPATLEDYLQLDDIDDKDGLNPSRDKKRVRWADLEEQKAQKKMRKMGFVVGVTDWSRMMDPTQGSSALTQTKYIAKIKKNT